MRVIPDLASGERAGVIELSRGVCTADPDLLAQAGAMGIPGYRPAELDAAIRDGTLGGLLTRPLVEALPNSA